MSEARTGGGLLHRLTHMVPGVPEHTDRPRGHQGRSPSLKGRSPRLQGRSPSFNHTTGRPPRVLVGWQRRIAAFFGRELP
ncbi:hypothetical protein [Dactylosporangium darangshiense]|uniref:Uncharacterized protein n=1 Tax=Dactylosporangium darangshiense TaxID=579108 RepID=A0ABP8DUD6_9ACTN